MYVFDREKMHKKHRFTQTCITTIVNTPYTPTSIRLSDKQEKEEDLVISLFFSPRKSKLNKKINEYNTVHLISVASD